MAYVDTRCADPAKSDGVRTPTHGDNGVMAWVIALTVAALVLGKKKAGGVSLSGIIS